MAPNAAVDFFGWQRWKSMSMDLILFKLSLICFLFLLPLSILSLLWGFRLFLKENFG